jgi:hypothetical protein
MQRDSPTSSTPDREPVAVQTTKAKNGSNAKIQENATQVCYQCQTR